MAREKHQTPTPSGTLAHIRIKGVLHRRHFRRGTDPLVIKQWLGMDMQCVPSSRQ